MFVVRLFTSLLFAYISCAFSTQDVLSIARNDQSSTAAENCEKACQELSSNFGPALHFGDNDPTFVIWDKKQQDAQPACRVTPVTAAEVAQALTIVSSHWCRFAVKGGGHSTNVDASNSVGGVTIDLGDMDHIDLAPDGRSWADLGPGLVLSDAYTYLEQYNLTNIGGRVADVGLPGYLIGGGISNLSPQYGLAVDNIYEYEVYTTPNINLNATAFFFLPPTPFPLIRMIVDIFQLVLPNATIINVTQSSQPDLYFALRGGGNNFGIITNFRVRLIPQGPMLSGTKVYHANYTRQIVDQTYQLTTTLSNDTLMCFSSRYAYNQTLDEFSVSMTQAYAQPILEPPVFATLNEVPYESSTVRVDWMSNFALESVQPPGTRQLFGTVTFDPSGDLHQQILDVFEDEVSQVKDIPGFTSSVVVSALHINAIKAMEARGGNALGVESDGPLDIALLTVGWSNATDDAAMNAFADTWITRSMQAASDVDRLHPWLYINYAKDTQDPFSGYGKVNKARLISIQEAIDPKGIFTSTGLCRGSFKLR
ncbi:hypothetical protein PFICI_07486 [Pestalotiopsis fici W106-1]|uniref:FAD-binding PCMH-type domain-containing protein n=1 Tax=Pestalotiopsis fici (strain W106-1 / CGMCC3.15140) TaxID=1229662 RepID=W3X3H9_PESFW|nr:uncharacterized protein PFICI_07486 [Pestalotiopsis fici W106-1]ETS79957.1 hypothetical protein PFICI_07486 [Pestalotiopsis fici W106-1]